MSTEILRGVAGALVGSVGFAVLVHAPLRSLLPGGLVAALTYLLYMVMTFFGIPDALAVFTGAFFGSLAGQWIARRMKMIGTIFLMSSVVPVVPGLGLYRAMTLVGQGATTAGVDKTFEAMITIAMIALGLLAGGYIDRHLHAKHFSR